MSQTEDSKVVELTAENFERVTAEGRVMVDFWAPWCGPCRMIAPVIEEVAEEMSGKAVVAKVNVDEEQDIAVKAGIRAVPTVVIFDKGKVVSTLVGAKAKNDYIQALSVDY